MSKLSLTVACNDADRVRAIKDGTIQIEGCDVNFFPLVSEEVFHRAHHGQQFDVCELSMSRYLISTSRGDSPYYAVPVFLSRVFRHNSIYIRNDRGITSPADLRGRLVGLPEYQMTAAFWVRVIFSDEYGVPPNQIKWRGGGLEMAGRHEMLKINLPKDVDLQSIPEDRTLSEMLAAGDLDAVIASKRPSCFTKGHPKVSRMFPNYREAERAYFKKTGIFPIMHVLGIRRELVEKHPWLAASVYKAFLEAKQAVMPQLAEIGVLSVTLPWLIAEFEETKEAMGEDYWPYGADANRKTVDAMIRHALEQGLISRSVSYDELFVPGADIQFKR